MGEIEEVTITDDKEFVYTLSTMQNNSADFITEIINGKLDCIIISAKCTVRIKVSLFEHPEIVLFDVIEFIGTEYVPLRISSKDAQNDIFNYSPQKLNLKNRLKFEIEGGLQTEASFIVRLL